MPPGASLLVEQSVRRPGAVVLRVAAALLLAAALVAAWLGYQRPDLLLELVTMPFC